MTAPKRVFLALGCVVLALLSVGSLGVASSARYGWRHVLPVIEMLPVSLMFALPGWVLTLPFVLLFKDARGWRTWAILGIGIGIGPAFFLGWTLSVTHGRLDWQANGFGVFMSVWIGTLTTMPYLLLLRHFGRVLPG